MTEKVFKYYQFEGAGNCLMIATSKHEAVSTYKSEVLADVSNSYLTEISHKDFVKKLALSETDDMPTIERGIVCAAIDTQNALFAMASSGEEAKILVSA